MIGLTIKRTGPQPVNAIDGLIRSDVGAEVAFHQDRLTRAALARGDLLDNEYTMSIQVGSTRRQVDSYDSIKRWPLPDYSTSTVGSASATDILDCAQEAIRLFTRAAPRSNVRKNHNYRYSQSLLILVDGREASTLPPLNRITGSTRIELIDVAPHASVIEARDRIMATIAKTLIAEYPNLAVRFDWVTSDTIGRRYGKGTGGPSEGSAIYALPRISIAATGPSGVATAKRKRRRRGSKGRGR